MSSFQLNIQELRDSSNVYVLNVRWFTSIKDIKDMIHRITRQPPRCLDLFYGTNARVLSNNMTLHDFGIERTGHTLRLAINNAHMSNNGSGSKVSYVLSPSRDSGRDSACRRMMQDVTIGLQSGLAPSRTDVLDCTGGVYFLKNIEKRKIAVFKPHDEEQGMPNNDKGYGGNGEHSLRPNFKPGQGCIREVAAYIMDVNNFTGVPPTTLVHCEHPNFNYSSHRSNGRSMSQFPKLGSLQKFVEAEGSFEDYGDNMYSDFEVQKLALFDIRTLNCDRNASNILLQRKHRMHSGVDILQDRDGGNVDVNSNNIYGTARRGSRSASLSSWENGNGYCSDDIFENSRSDDEGDDGSGSTSRSGSFAETERRAQNSRNIKDRYVLIPIDHGYCCPSALDIKEWDWAWFHLPHLKRPVHHKIKEYLLSIDLDKMCNDLEQRVSMSEESLFLIRLTHNLLVSGVEAGLTLYDIAGLIARLDEDEPSPLERAIAVGEENALRAIDMRSGRLNSRGAPSLRLESGGRGPGQGRSRPTTPLGVKQRASDENLCSTTNSNSNSTTKEEGGVASVDGEGDLFGIVPLAKHGSSSSMGSSGSGGFGIGYAGDDSDVASDMDIFAGNVVVGGVGISEEKPGGTQSDLVETFDNECSISPRSSTASGIPPLSPSTPVVSPSGNASIWQSKYSASGDRGTASFGLGVGLAERVNGLAGAPLSRMQTLQTPQMSTFKDWQTTAHLSPTSNSMRLKKGDEAQAYTPPPQEVSLANDTFSRPRFTQSGRDWLKSASNQQSPPSGIALKFDKLVTDDDDADNKMLSPLSDPFEAEAPSKSAMPSPMTDVASSGNFDMMDNLIGADKSPRMKKRGSPTSKHRRRAKTTATEDVAVSNARATDADVDTDVEGSTPNDSNEEDESKKKMDYELQQVHRPSKPSRSPAKNESQPSSSLKNSNMLMRVTSFSAFSNAPLYDMEEGERHYGRLNREKRRFQVSTAEFKTLREHFTNDRVSILIGKARSGSGLSSKEI